jgi:hypothetical protein
MFLLRKINISGAKFSILALLNSPRALAAPPETCSNMAR